MGPNRPAAERVERAGMRLAGATLAGLAAAVGASGVGASPRIPVPRTYNETCTLVRSWCTPPVEGSLPPELRRPLQLPHIAPGGSCPTSRGRSFHTSSFGTIALGRGPVQPGIGVARPHVAAAKRGVLSFTKYYGGGGWYFVKTLWFGRPRYQGPLLIRGRRLDAPGRIVMGESPSLVDPQLPPGPTVNDDNGWRTWPGGTYVRAAGCYGWQVDGEDFTTVIVFEATLVR